MCSALLCSLFPAVVAGRAVQRGFIAQRMAIQLIAHLRLVALLLGEIGVKLLKGENG